MLTKQNLAHLLEGQIDDLACYIQKKSSELSAADYARLQSQLETCISRYNQMFLED